MNKTGSPNEIQFLLKNMNVVVSTIISVFLFACFCIVEIVTLQSSFLFMTSLLKKVLVKKESPVPLGRQFLWVGLLISSHSFHKLTLFGNKTIWVDLATHTVWTCLTIQKRAKRMPDIIFKTTKVHQNRCLPFHLGRAIAVNCNVQ